MATDGQSGAGARRTLYGRAIACNARRPLQRARPRRAEPRSTCEACLGFRRCMRLASPFAACTSATTGGARSATSPATTTSTRASTISSSIRTASTAAPISNIPANRSTTRRRRRSATSPPSSCRRTARRRSTSAAVSAAWRSISPGSQAQKSPASRCRRNNSRSRRTAPATQGWPTGSSSGCRTIATFRRPSTASFRSACSSMSASTAMTNFSPPPVVC